MQRMFQEKLRLYEMDYIPLEFFTVSEQTTIKNALSTLHLWAQDLNWEPLQKQIETKSLDNMVRPFQKGWDGEVQMVKKCVQHLLKQGTDPEIIAMQQSSEKKKAVLKV